MICVSDKSIILEKVFPLKKPGQADTKKYRKKHNQEKGPIGLAKMYWKGDIHTKKTCNQGWYHEYDRDNGESINKFI